MRRRGHFNILRCAFAGDARLRGTPIAGNNRHFILEQMRSPKYQRAPFRVHEVEQVVVVPRSHLRQTAIH